MRILVFIFILISFSGYSQYDSLIQATQAAITEFNPNKALDAIEKGRQSSDIDEAGNREFDVLNIKVLEIAGLNDRVIEISNKLLQSKEYTITQQIQVRLSRSLAYEILNESKLCTEEFERMSQLFEKLGDTTNRFYGNYLYRKCSFYRVTGDSVNAVRFAQRSEKHALKYGHEDNLAVTNLLLSFVNKTSAERRYYTMQALNYWRKVKDFHGMSAMYAALSRMAQQKGDYQMAMLYVDSILNLPLESHLDDLRAHGHLMKSTIFEKLSLPDSALLYHKKYLHYSTQKDYLAQQVKLKELQQAYKTREIELINEDLRKTKENTESRNQSLIISLIVLGVGVLIFIILIIKVTISQKEIRRSNTLLSQTLMEKRILLKEVNHRVKNNLSLVINLIKFQEDATDNEVAKNQLNDLYYRVESMSLAQRGILADSNENEMVSQSMRTYVTNLISNIVSIDPRKISLKLDVVDVQLYVNTMIPLGLILNELVSNTLKHTDAEEIVITSAISIEDNELLLDYRNNPKTPQGEEKTNGMGMFILQGMVEQMNGTMSHDNYDYTIRLRIK